MTKKEIENILKNYHWMLNSIKIMRNDVSSKTSQYGIEASLPKPKGTTSDPVYSDVIRRTKYCKRIEQYEKKVKAIQERMHLITDDREVEVLFWLLEGKSYRWIGAHMGLSFSHIKRIRDSIVETLADETNGTNGTEETNFGNQKSAC